MSLYMWKKIADAYDIRDRWLYKREPFKYLKETGNLPDDATIMACEILVNGEWPTTVIFVDTWEKLSDFDAELLELILVDYEVIDWLKTLPEYYKCFSVGYRVYKYQG